MPPTKRESGPPIVRMAHPMAFTAYLHHIGAPVQALQEKEGLPVAAEDPNAFVPLPQTWGFFDAATRREDPMLAWHVGIFTGDHHLNRPLLAKLEQAPTLYKALQRFIRLIGSEASHIQMGLREREDDVLLYTQYPGMKGVRGYYCSQVYKVGVFLNIVRHYAGETWSPSEIGIDHPVVPANAAELYPGARILACQPFAYVAIPRSLLHLPPRILTSLPPAEDKGIVFASAFSFQETLIELLKPRLHEGFPHANLAAGLMDTSVRTLARRLADSGTSYRLLVDELRFAEAKTLLSQPDTRITDVAAAVGFDDPSHFARMFRRVGGLSPREFVRSQAQPQDHERGSCL